MSLQRVDTRATRLTAYDGLADPVVVEGLRAMARQLRGLRVVHINATPVGGGVAEILRSIVPLMQDLGVDPWWYVLPPDNAAFSVTKKFHNALQGRPRRVTAKDRLRRYDRAIFSMPEYVLPGLRSKQARIVHPAIDPLVPKNSPMNENDVGRILHALGVDRSRPIMTQVSRFDRWKNPWQAVDTYRLAKQKIRGIQLAMLGVFHAKDDPEGPQVYRAIRRYAGSDPDVHLFTDAGRVGAREVNAFQSASDVMPSDTEVAA